MEKTPFWQSRKFGYLLADVIAGLLALWVGVLIKDTELQRLILATWGLLQPMIWFVVWGITTEDKAAYAAGVHPKQLAMGDHINGDKTGDDAVSVLNVNEGGIVNVN